MIAMKSPVLDQEVADDVQLTAGPAANIVDSSDDQKDGLMDTQQDKTEGTRLVEQPTADVTQSEEEHKSDNADTTVLEEIHLPPSDQYSGVITTKRKVFAYTALTIMICICIEGFVMNLIDVIDVFKK